jgi:glycosyltransferase involved in cell wall biosynthesis
MTIPIRVSVVIPVFNGHKYLAEAVECVLGQQAHHSELEIIVVDDGSTDGSAALARTLGGPVRVFEQPNRGAGAARNSGVAHATGEFLAFLDCDDCWEPGKLALQLAAFREKSSLDIVFTHVLNFHSPELNEEQRARIVCRPDAIAGIIPSTMLVRRSSFERAGPFPEDTRLGELVPWLARAMDLGMQIETLPDVLARRRLHETNTGRRLQHDRGDYVRMVRQVLLRRTAAGGSGA